MIRKVHVVFKTHLDLGFTDTARAVERHYLRSFIPAAIRAAEALNLPGRPPRFIWTVGAYLIDLALRELPAEEAARLERAVRLGHVCYHALPFTTHSELCSDRLFRAGLQISGRLDARFGRRTVAAKMSDVPGHSAGIIAPLCDSGVRYLHIGINAVAPMPDVPPLFLWENAAGQRLMVNYTRSYGGLTLIPGHDEALCIMHGGDNAGPPEEAAIDRCFEQLRQRYPEALITASTLDGFARSLAPLEGALPVVRGEIGDTWIHGVGSDPEKTSRLRALDRLCARWAREGRLAGLSAADGRPLEEAFLQQLLLVCEHTWGMDSKKYLTDFANWRREDFERARGEDLLRDEWGLGRGYDSQFAFARREFEAMRPENLSWGQRSYSLFESSHEEQRAYIVKALALLPETLRKEAEASILTSQPAPAAGPGGFEAAPEGGEIVLSAGGREALRVLPPVYQETGLESYDRLFSRYLCDVAPNADWAIPDNGKPGAELSDAPRQDVNHVPAALRAVRIGEALHIEGRFPEGPVRLAGCPARFTLRLEPAPRGFLITLRLTDKAANRKPEALFLPFSLGDGGSLRLEKLGEWIDPAACLPGGNRRTHAVQSLRYERNGLRLRLSPLDSPLVCLCAPRPLDFEGEPPNGLIYACLYNNLWGTNFKMWYEEDITARFLLSAESMG